MKYNRPELIPFALAPLVDRSADPAWRVAGTRADTLRFMTQLRDITLSVVFNYDFTDGLGNPRNVSLDAAFSIRDPGIPGPVTGGSTGQGYFYQTTNPVPAVFADPASRVLADISYLPAPVNPPLPDLFKVWFSDASKTQETQRLSLSLFFNRTPAGVLQPRLYIAANLVQGAFVSGVASFDPAGAGAGSVLGTSNNVVIGGVNFGPLTVFNSYYTLPVSAVSGSCVVTTTTIFE